MLAENVLDRVGRILQNFVDKEDSTIVGIVAFRLSGSNIVDNMSRRNTLLYVASGSNAKLVSCSFDAECRTSLALRKS